MSAVVIKFGEADVDAEDRDLLARQLRGELLALEVDEVRLVVEGAVPRNAKGTAASTGELIVSLANSAAFGAVMTSLVQVLRAWISRGQGRNVIVKDGDRSLELTGASVEQQQQAVDTFVRSMASGSASNGMSSLVGSAGREVQAESDR
ncbi:MAG TPA: hypothetical protein VHX38_38470 [Pseudonocardiaceae bacterium]|jgi:hypothetical protein|nr:hypothetical protein [Pseudonocardiaceae bacterium]